MYIASPQDQYLRHITHHNAPEAAAQQLPTSQGSCPAAMPARLEDNVIVRQILLEGIFSAKYDLIKPVSESKI